MLGFLARRQHSRTLQFDCSISRNATSQIHRNVTKYSRKQQTTSQTRSVKERAQEEYCNCTTASSSRTRTTTTRTGGALEDWPEGMVRCGRAK